MCPNVYLSSCRRDSARRYCRTNSSVQQPPAETRCYNAALSFVPLCASLAQLGGGLKMRGRSTRKTVHHETVSLYGFTPITVTVGTRDCFAYAKNSGSTPPRESPGSTTLWLTAEIFLSRTETCTHASSKWENTALQAAE